MILGLDIDGVVADFLNPFLRFVEKKLGNGPIPAETVTDWNFRNHPYLTEKEVWDCMVEISYDPRFWSGLASLISREEWQKLERLSNQGQLIFVSHRYERENYSIHEVTSDWLKTHGISNPIVHFTQDSKANLVPNLGIRLFVDDRYENCVEVAERTQALVLMPHRPYNQSFTHPRVKRIQDFRELFAYIP